MFGRANFLLLACLLAAVALAGASAASAETQVISLRYTGLNANCPGFTVPPDLTANPLVGAADLYLSTEFTQTREWGTIPPWIRAGFPWIGVHNTLITTALHAEGHDGIGTFFVVDGKFVNSVVGDYPLELGAPGDYGRGDVTIVREDGAKMFLRNAQLRIPRWSAAYIWLPDPGSSVTCAGHWQK